MKDKEQCIFPMCTRKVDRDQLCFLHAKHFAGVKEAKTTAPISKKSDSMKEELKKYTPAAKKFLAKNKLCQIKMNGCTKEATVVHHSAGRIGAKLHDQEDWLASCANCNLMVEIKDMEAREKGFKKSKFKKEVA